MTVYADISFLTNFVFDAEILILLCKIFSKKTPKIKIFISATLGGLAGICAFVPYFEIISIPPFSFIVSAVMVYIVFKPSKLKVFFENWLSFMTISFVMSGAMIFFDLSIIPGLLMPIIIYFLICIIKKNIHKKKSEVILKNREREIVCEGFLDSGNMLMLSGMPVILGNERIFEMIFGHRIEKNELLNLSKNYDVRVIPFKSLGKSGTIIGIKMESVLVNEKKYDNVILAYTEDNFSDDLILNSIMT